jgi:transposase-like protein
MRKRLPDREDVWTPEDARRVLDEAARSGEPLAAFARRHGVGPSRLYWWRKRLATEPSPIATPTLSLVPAMVAREPTVAIIVRMPGDVSIEIADATPSTVVAITAALARSLP